jgi:hypothetical protein
MSIPLRAWLLSVAVILVGSLGVGALATTDPADAVLTVAAVLVLVVAVLLAGRWYQARRPEGGLGEYLLAVVSFPALFSLFGLEVQHRADAQPRSLLIGAVVDAVVVGLTAAAIRLRSGSADSRPYQP